MTVQAISDEFRVGVERINGLLDLGFSKADIYRIVAPQRTLGRRKKKLSLEESDKVQRRERIVELSTRVFGSQDKANGWLRKANRALQGAIPIDLLVSETGARKVEMQLHAIDFGMYA